MVGGSLRFLRVRAACVAGLAACFALAGSATSASAAAPGDTYVDVCTNAGASQAPCSGAAGQAGAYREALSPDGKQLYLVVSGGTPPGGATAEDAAIRIYDRNPSTGQVTRRDQDCVTTSGSSGACITAPNLINPQDIVVSPDGANVYVSDAGSNTILEFSRASNGSLTLMSECQGTATPCAVVTGIGQPHALGLSPDGSSLYLRSAAPGNGSQGTLVVFDRASNGQLTQKATPNGCWSEVALTGCSTAAGIAGQSWQIAVTNTNVYVTGRTAGYTWYDYGCIQYGFCGYYIPMYVPASGTLAIFGRSPDGTLTQAAQPNGCISNNGTSGGSAGAYPGNPAPVRCIDGSDGLADARSAAASPDGKSVYVATLSAIVGYARAGDGSVSAAGCLERAGATLSGCTEAAGIADDYRMAFTPSGDELVVTAVATGGVAFLDRNTSTGVLSERTGTKRCITFDGSSGACETLAPLGGLGDVAVSSDAMFVYLVSQTNGVLATLHRDFAPVCQSQSLSVPYQTSAVAPLSCTDANHDPLTLAISRQPFAGTLGAIDQAAGRIYYNPFSAFVGADSFEFTATGQGVTSAPATVSLNVQSQQSTSTDQGSASAPAGNPAPPSTPKPSAPAQPTASMSGAPTMGDGQVSFMLACAAVPCRGGASLMTIQKLLGRKIVALSAGSKAKRKALSVGSVRFSVDAGKKLKIVVKLNKAGKAMLKRFHKLPAKLTIWLTGVDGTRMNVVSKKLLLKPVKKTKRA